VRTRCLSDEVLRSTLYWTILGTATLLSVHSQDIPLATDAVFFEFHHLQCN
jgi:DMSO reductase anchor subunit